VQFDEIIGVSSHEQPRSSQCTLWAIFSCAYPDSRLPIPDSLFPIPYSLFPLLYKFKLLAKNITILIVRL
ncbi:MAG: hypothetical protein F6J98_29735, partial [Moorea sp. SIO4G2]|nr:hypothetical protein [Moorena sp. SIO4G2]